MKNENKIQNNAKLTQGSVGKLLIKLTIPMIWGLVAIMTFNLVDTIFIGRLGTTPLAAISFTFPIVMVATNLAIGLGIGTSSVVARAIGEQDNQKIRNLATSSLLLSIFIVGTFVTIGFLTIKPLFFALGADEAILPLIEQYMQIWYAGMIFLVVPMVGNYIIRATGDMFWPGVIMVFSSILNLILDPILIFGLFGFPRLEMRGAAIATVIAWIATFLASTAILTFREKLIQFRCPKIFVILNNWRSVLHVAIPAAGTHMIIPIGMGIILSMISSFGEEAVAAFGAATRIEMFAFIVYMALSAVIGPFVGQNFSAQRYDRIQEALRLCYKFCFYFGLSGAVFLAIFSKQLILLFNDHPLVVHYGQIYLLMAPLAYGAQGIVFIASGVFNGSGHPIPAVIISVSRMFILYIPLAFFLKFIFGIYGIFGAYPIATMTMSVVALFWSFNLISNKG